MSLRNPKVTFYFPINPFTQDDEKQLSKYFGKRTWCYMRCGALVVATCELFLIFFTKLTNRFSMKIQWRLHIFPCRLKDWIIFKVAVIKLVFLSLCYNSFMSCSYVLETGLEPMFWIVDHFTKYLGPIFVTLVVVLTTSVVTVVYVCFIPHAYYQSSIIWTAIHVTTGHWLLLNIVYNYVMAAVTDPGIPSQHVPEVVSICRKCISPKPPRCHHCSVCNRCILKMDHHCPWLNNCVGFYNHRYFLLFCIYMTLGTIYTSMLGYDLFKQHFYGEKDLVFPGVFYPLNAAYDVVSKMNTTKHDKINSSVGASNLLDEPEKVTFKDQFYHNAVVFNFILCSGVSVALGCLSLYHAYIISKGETSIEVHINSKERKRKKKKGQRFRNPYNFGFIENWRLFLGLTDKKSVWKVLFPSIYRPEGNGLTWKKNFGTFTVDDKMLQVL